MHNRLSPEYPASPESEYLYRIVATRLRVQLSKAGERRQISCPTRGTSRSGGVNQANMWAWAEPMANSAGWLGRTSTQRLVPRRGCFEQTLLRRGPRVSVPGLRRVQVALQNLGSLL